MSDQNKMLAGFAIILLLACAAGALSGYHFGKANTYMIYTADIKKISDEKKNEIVKRLKQEGNTPEIAAALEKEYADFLTKTDKVLDAYKKADKKAIILRKEAIIEGNFTDITDEMRQLIAADTQKAPLHAQK